MIWFFFRKTAASRRQYHADWKGGQRHRSTWDDLVLFECCLYVVIVDQQQTKNYRDVGWRLDPSVPNNELCLLSRWSALPFLYFSLNFTRRKQEPANFLKECSEAVRNYSWRNFFFWGFFFLSLFPLLFAVMCRTVGHHEKKRTSPFCFCQLVFPNGQNNGWCLEACEASARITVPIFRSGDSFLFLFFPFVKMAGIDYRNERHHFLL